MVWVKEDTALRCSSSSPFSTRIKRKGGKTTKKGLRKKAKRSKKMVDDEPVGRKSVTTSRKEKEIMYEFPGPSPTKESQVSVTNYKRVIVNGKAKMVEVEDVGLVKCRCSLEEGLTIVEGDGDMNKLYDIAEKYGLINLYIAHLPKNLAEYYYKNLTLDASDEEVKSKQKSYEKRKLDACFMSPHELVECEQQEAGSPYLRTPPLNPRRKGIEFPCKNLFRDFLHCDSVADEVVLHDNWQYKGLALDGYIDVGGSGKHCDLEHENVVDNGHSLLNMDKEIFSNNFVLELTRCLNNSKTMRLRKGHGKRVACGANNRRLGSFIVLNVHAVDDDPHVTKQVSLTAGSSNSECIPGAGDTYLPYNLSRVVAHTSRTADR
ncbi:hypothetical protein Tco_0407538 [Tanacetum coccineum]